MRALVLLLSWLILSGCAPSLVSVLREDPRQPGNFTPHGDARIAGAISLTRNGRALDARVPAMLKPGDVLETGPDAGAVIRYPDGGEVLLDTHTRVRIGSLFVDFGLILVRVRGWFSVDTENVVTGVEGTEFVLEVARDGDLKVIVLDGIVIANSRTASWKPVRLARGEMLVSDFPNRSSPRVRPVAPDEWNAILERIDRLEGRTGAAPEPLPPGYCCHDGKIRRSTPNECPGFFSSAREEAMIRCDEPQKGYCCEEGQVSPTLPNRCPGRFFTDRGAAYEYCQRPPESGYCCSRGEVLALSRDRCEGVRGRFYRDRREAERVCAPSVEEGYCCDRGKTYTSTRDRCEGVKGRFYRDRREAERVCAPSVEEGYCCDRGKTYTSTRDRCEGVKGRFYRDRREAERVCTPSVEEGYCCDRGKTYTSTRARCEGVKGRFYRDRREAERVCRPPPLEIERQPVAPLRPSAPSAPILN